MAQIDTLVQIRQFMGLRRDMLPSHLGPADGVAHAQTAQNVTSELRGGGLAPRRGLLRVVFDNAFTASGLINSFGQVTVAGRTRIFALHSSGALRRYDRPRTLVTD